MTPPVCELLSIGQEQSFGMPPAVWVLLAVLFGVSLVAVVFLLKRRFKRRPATAGDDQVGDSPFGPALSSDSPSVPAPGDEPSPDPTASSQALTPDDLPPPEALPPVRQDVPEELPPVPEDVEEVAGPTTTSSTAAADAAPDASAQQQRLLGPQDKPLLSTRRVDQVVRTLVVPMQGLAVLIVEPNPQFCAALVDILGRGIGFKTVRHVENEREAVRFIDEMLRPAMTGEMIKDRLQFDLIVLSLGPKNDGQCLIPNLKARNEVKVTPILGVTAYSNFAGEVIPGIEGKVLSLTLDQETFLGKVRWCVDEGLKKSPLLDRVFFETVVSPMLGGGEGAEVDLAIDFVETMCEQADRHIPAARLALEDGDWEKMELVVHGMKGSAQTLGFKRLGLVFCRLEVAAKNKQIDRYRELLPLADELCQKVDRLHKEMKRHGILGIDYK